MAKLYARESIDEGRRQVERGEPDQRPFDAEVLTQIAVKRTAGPIGELVQNASRLEHVEHLPDEAPTLLRSKQ